MRNKGFALVTVIIGLVIISVMAVFFTSFVIKESSISVDKFFSTKSFYAAQAGVEYAKRRLSLTNAWYTLNEGNYVSSSQNLDNASFEVTLKLAATALKQGLNPSNAPNQTIQVYSTDSFSSSNILILIDDEQILCSGKTISPPSFTGCSRDVNGTYRAKHSVGTNVYPVAIVSSVNAAARAITVDPTYGNSKFLNSGVLLIDNDPSFASPVEVSYTDKGLNIFYGCDDVSAVNPGSYVIPKDEQIEITSKGNFKGFERQIQTVLYR